MTDHRFGSTFSGSDTGKKYIFLLENPARMDSVGNTSQEGDSVTYDQMALA